MRTLLHARPSVRSRNLIRRLARVGIVLLGLGVAPSEAASQGPEGERDVARAILDLDLRLGRLAGRSVALGGGRAMLELRPGFRVGGGVHIVLRRVYDIPERTGPGRNLTLAYAGPVVEIKPSGSPVTARLLVGAALATLRDDAVGTRVGSDISTALVPELVVPLVRWHRVESQLGAGVRYVFQSRGPGPLAPSDLRSAFLSFTLRFGPL